jgi:ADP-heptose:LPS heptosyltransferase
MATPALQMLKSRFPAARMVLVGSAGTIKLFEGVPIFDDRVTIPPEAFDLSVGPPPSLYAALSRVSRLCPDLVFASYLHHRWIVEVIDRLGARWVVGTEEDGEPRQMTHRLPAPPDRNFVEINVDLARAAGCAGPVPPMQLWINEAERNKAKDWVRRHDLKPPIVGFHVGVKEKHWQRRWPAQNFAELGNLLQEKWDARVVLLKGPDDGPAVEKTAAGLRHPPAVAGGELSLRETAALVEQMDVMVSNNSIWMHAAAAVRTPVVGLFGPASPSNYHPWGDPEITKWIASPAECAPCWDRQNTVQCTDPHCMTDIAVSKVGSVVDGLLNRGQ